MQTFHFLLLSFYFSSCPCYDLGQGRLGNYSEDIWGLEVFLLLFTLNIIIFGSSERTKELYGKHNSFVLHLLYYFFGVCHELGIRNTVANKTCTILVFMVLVFLGREPDNKPNQIILDRGQSYREKEQDLVIRWEWG